MDILTLYLKMTALAFLLDLLIGDPQQTFHPVRGMGWLNAKLENYYRNLYPKHESAAGLFTTLTVLGLCGGLTWAIMHFTGNNIYAGAVIIYFCIAARDLRDHALRILKPLEEGDLVNARQKLAMIVGRDTETLDESQISRATVESVAENTVDGVTAPLIYALIFGPLGAVLYRAINTMDSMFGYKNEKYIRFGIFPARLDDVANYIPARLTGYMICLASFAGFSPLNAFKMMQRDGQKHPSPNSGISEAAAAGALQIQLGGPSTYAGILSEKQTLGEPINELNPSHIRKAVILMYLTSILFLVTAFLLITKVPY